MRRIQSWLRGKKKATWMSLALLGVLSIGLIWGVYRRQTLNSRLIGAVKREDARAVADLVAQGADPNATAGTPVFWGTLLHFIMKGHSSESGGGEPALLLIGAERNHYDTAAEDALCTTLLEHGANPTVRDKAGLTILFYASALHLHRTVSLLLSRGVNPKERLPDGSTPLMVADATDTLALLQHGADVSPTHLSGYTALHYACHDGAPEKVRLLLSSHAVVDAKAADGTTPLMLARNPQIIRQLLDHGANVDARSQDGSTAITCLSDTTSTDLEGIKLLLQHRAHIDDHFRSGWSALHNACYNSNVPLARFLLDHGADIEAQASGGLTPLMCAREPAIALLLLSHGAQIDVRDDEGRTDLDRETDLLNQQRDARAVKMIPLLKQYAAKHPAKQAPANAPDGREILLKTMQMYQALHSYSGETNVVWAFIPQNGQTLRHSNTSSTMKLQRPNKIFLSFAALTGSHKITSDGTHFRVYDSATKQSLTVPTASDLTGLMQLLKSKGKVTTNLDPLFFLSSKSLPQELSNLKIKASTTYDGRPVYVVTGTTHAGIAGLTTDKSLPVPTSSWKWWIDRRSSELYKIETTTPSIVAPIPSGAGPKRVVKKMKGTLFIRQTISKLRLNADIAPSEFDFTPSRTGTPKR